MPATIDDGRDETARQSLLVRTAFERGQTALASGDKPDAVRWLERAHRLAPRDNTITLVLASAAIGYDNPRAAAWFGAVLACADVRDAGFGLATARLLMGDLAAARAAVTELLSRHVVWADIAGLAGQLARATGAAGWCGLTGAGLVVVHSTGHNASGQPVDIRIDGAPLADRVAMKLPATWPRAGSMTVTAGGNGSERRHLIGSPVSLRAIGRVEGHVEASDDGIRGWAWCPGDPDANPHLVVSAGRWHREFVATDTASEIPGLAPLARPRSFAIPWDSLPAGTATIRVRGRDGLELPGSPITRYKPGSVSSYRSRRSMGSAGSTTSRSNAAIATARRRALAQWRGLTGPAVVLVTHDDGGGVERRIQTSVASHRALGRRAIVLRPPKSPGGATRVVDSNGSLPDLCFELPRERRSLLHLLTGLQPIAVELHHFLNHDASVLEIVGSLGIPYDTHVHDYAWFCPRVALVGQGDRYCGEPAPSVCQSCVTELGSYLHEDIGVAALLDRSRSVLTAAQRIIAPSHDAAARLARHFPGLSPSVIPHEDDTEVPEPPQVTYTGGTVRVCLAGAIGLHKGFDVLLACASDARQRDLDLTFIVAGTTIDDQRLMDTGRVFVTGPYQPEEAVALIRAQSATLALLPSIWPETWCLGLTELWRAGLRVAAFDIGAPAERIRRTGRGFLLPLQMTPVAINDTLLKAARGRSLLPIHGPSAYKVSN